MKPKTFEDYLQQYHAENDEDCGNGQMLLECYESWVSELDGQEIIDIAEWALTEDRKTRI